MTSFVSPREGYYFARNGYEAECRDNDREANWKYFDTMMLGLLGATPAETPPEPAVEPEEPPYDVPWPTDADEPLEGVQEPTATSAMADAIAETQRAVEEP